MTDFVSVQNGLSVAAIVVACGALAVSFLAYRQARKTAALSSRREAIVHVRNAIFDVARDGNITTKTVASIRDALQISSLVSQPKIIDELDQAFMIASRLEHKPFERLTDQDFNDRALLEDLLNDVLQAMTEEARL
jgi:hypothetical protein